MQRFHCTNGKFKVVLFGINDRVDYPWYVWLNTIENSGLESATGKCTCDSDGGL